MKEYYSGKDVQKITGASMSLSYQIIRKLKESFEKEFPDSIPIKGRIPVWYFNEKMGLKEVTNENKN